ncbi:MAG: hypothetical protein ACOC3I_11210, partial [Verrucomicrobiota bacterium]
MRVVQRGDGKVESVADDLAQQEVTTVGLHLLEVLMELAGRHEGGGLGPGVVGGLGRALAGGEVEAEIIEVALHASHELPREV